MTVTRNRFYLFGYPISHSGAPSLHNFIFEQSGLLECNYALEEAKDIPSSRFQQLVAQDDFGGTAVTMPLKVEVVKYLDRLTDAGKDIGSVNTVFLEFESGSSKPTLVGTNTDWLGVRNSLIRSLQLNNPKANISSAIPSGSKPATIFPEGKAYSFIIGSGGTTRAAVYALNSLGCSPIYLMNRDPEETAGVVAHFPNLELIPLASAAEAKAAVEEQERAGRRLSVAVGAIPSFAPVTELEIAVYDIAHVMLNAKDIGGELTGRHFLEMAYKPLWTPMMTNAKNAGWIPISGIEAMIEQGLAQQYLWQHKENLGQVDDAARDYIRNKYAASES